VHGGSLSFAGSLFGRGLPANSFNAFRTSPPPPA
jgi:hypothetical protein